MPGFPGGAKDLFDGFALGNLPRQGMLTSTTANDQNLHFISFPDSLIT